MSLPLRWTCIDVYKTCPGSWLRVFRAAFESTYLPGSSVPRLMKSI